MTEKNITPDSSNTLQNKTHTLSYNEALAASLIYYAEEDDRFALHLSELIHGLPESESHGAALPSKDHLALLHPKDEMHAVRRADWLISELCAENLTHAAESRTLLQSWAHARDLEEPTSIVTAIKVGVFPGISLGHLKMDERMPIILRRDHSDSSNLELVTNVSRASLEVLSHSIEQSGGDTRRLEPEIADWFFGDKTLVLYTATKDQMEHIASELESVNSTYASVADEHGRAILAISPSINTKYHDLHWNLQPLNIATEHTE